MALPKTLQRLWDRNNDKIENIFHEDDNGWWIDLKYGWCWWGCGSVHEDTIKDLIQSFKDIEYDAT